MRLIHRFTPARRTCRIPAPEGFLRLVAPIRRGRTTFHPMVNVETPLGTVQISDDGVNGYHVVTKNLAYVGAAHVVIGKDGCIIKAVRTVLTAAALNQNKRVTLKLEDVAESSNNSLSIDF